MYMRWGGFPPFLVFVDFVDGLKNICMQLSALVCRFCIKLFYTWTLQIRINTVMHEVCLEQCFFTGLSMSIVVLQPYVHSSCRVYKTVWKLLQNKLACGDASWLWFMPVPSVVWPTWVMLKLFLQWDLICSYFFSACKLFRMEFLESTAIKDWNGGDL